MFFLAYEIFFTFLLELITQTLIDLQFSYALSTQDLVTFAKLQRELFRKLRQKRESLAKVTRCVRTKCVGTL